MGRPCILEKGGIQRTSPTPNEAHGPGTNAPRDARGFRSLFLSEDQAGGFVFVGSILCFSAGNIHMHRPTTPMCPSAPSDRVVADEIGSDLIERG